VRSTETLYERITRLWRATGRFTSERHFLRECGVSQSYLSEFKLRLEGDPNAGLGSQIAADMAGELGISIEDLLGKPPLHESDDTYPSRSAAVGAARLLQYPESAIAEVMAETPGHDPGPRYWIRRIEAASEAKPPSDERRRLKRPE